MDDSPCGHCPAGLSWLIHNVQGAKEGESQCASLFQVTACVIFPNILLTEANHIAKPRFMGGNKTLPPDGRSDKGSCLWGLEKFVVILKLIPVTIEVFLCVQ